MALPEIDLPDQSIRVASDSSEPGCNRVRQWLRDYNRTANREFMERIHDPEHSAEPLILLAESGSRVVGGLFADMQLSWLRISLMAVDPERRSEGIGGRLLAEAERYGIACGCRYAYVDTMEYQAPEFYGLHGFEIVGRIPDWDSHGHAKLFLAKTLM